MIPLLTAAEMRALDEHTIQGVGVPGAVLMETAGRGVFEHLWAAYGERARGGPVAVVCGRGNNGGDGFVVARCLLNRGCPVTAYLLGRREQVAGDAAVHLGAYLGSGGAVVEVAEGGSGRTEAALQGAVLLVDAVLGTGLADDVRGRAAAAIDWFNRAEAPVVSVDVPSGVASDSGRVCGTAVEADLTVTFAFPKRGHFLYPGRALTGRLEVVDIGIPPAALAQVSPALYRLDETDFQGLLRRAPDAHKGTLGHVVVLAGSPGMTGAAGMAAWAALRAGAGLATVGWTCGSGADRRLPLEIMTRPLGGPEGGGWSAGLWDEARDLAERAAALVVGPGMGTEGGAAEFLGRVLEAAGAPAVVDADGLNLLAAHPSLAETRVRELVLTPHPGEAARLLGTTTGEVQADRVGSAGALAERYGCCAILKGAGTLVTAPGEPCFLVPRGNPGMATAGAGDVLSGVVGALLARGLGPLDAARLGAWAHAAAGDLAADRVGAEGMTATDILGAVPSVLESLRSGGATVS